MTGQRVFVQMSLVFSAPSPLCSPPRDGILEYSLCKLDINKLFTISMSWTKGTMLLPCLTIGAIDVPDWSIVMLIGIGLFQQGVTFRAGCRAGRFNGFNAEWFNNCAHIRAPQNEAPNRSLDKIMGLMRRGCPNWTALSARKSLLTFKAGVYLSIHKYANKRYSSACGQ